MKLTKEHRDKLAAEAGEGVYYNNGTGGECFVDVTFYPRIQLWIKENGERRKIDKTTLATNYHTLKL